MICHLQPQQKSYGRDAKDSNYWKQGPEKHARVKGRVQYEVEPAYTDYNYSEALILTWQFSYYVYHFASKIVQFHSLFPSILLTFC